MSRLFDRGGGPATYSGRAGRPKAPGTKPENTGHGDWKTGLATAAKKGRFWFSTSPKKTSTEGDPGWREKALTCLAILLAVLIAFGSRAFRVGFSWDTYIDEINYLQISQGVVRTGWVIGNEGPFYLHPPLFFFVEAAYIKVFGVAGNLIEQMQSVRYLGAAFAGLSAGMLLQVGRLLAGWPAGIAAAALFVLDPFSNKVNGHNMLDTPAMLWLLLGYGLLFSALVRGRQVSWPRTGCAGFLFGLAILTKEVSVFVTLLPMGICFVLGWGIPRAKSFLAGTVAVAVYASYPAAVYARGDWPLFVEKKFDGISRLAGFVQFTGFNQEGGPSFLGALVTRLDEYGTTYALMAAGGTALVILLLTDLGHDPARRLLVVWTSSAYALLAYITVFGTLEDQFFYYLVLPSTVTTSVTATLVLRETPLGDALRAAEERPWLVLRAAALGFVVFLTLWNAYLWGVIHTVPDNGYQRVEAFVEGLPDASRIAVTSETARLLMPELTDGATYRTVKGLRKDGVDYVIINEELVTEGWEEPPPKVYRWVKDNGRLAYGFESSRSSGLVGVWRLGDPSPGTAEASAGKARGAETNPAAGPNGAPSAGDAGCEGDEYVCIRDRVSEVAPGAEYVGGRIDVETDGSAPNRNVLFFEDPAMEICEHKKLERTAEGSFTSYVAIVAGSGSYGRGCVPELSQ